VQLVYEARACGLIFPTESTAGNDVIRECLVSGKSWQRHLSIHLYHFV